MQIEICAGPRPWTPFGPAGHTRGCHRHPALRAPTRGAATLVRTCSYVLFFPVRPWTSSTASRSPFPVRGEGCATCCALVLPKGKSLSEGMCSAWRRAAIARNRMEGTREHKRSVGAWRPLASRLRAALLPRPRLFTFSCALKPECIPQRLTSSVSLRLPPSPEGKAFVFSCH